jgi:tetratricopeptide (TPR) repeat protein
MHRLNNLFDDLADLAAAHAQGATGVTNTEVIRWVEMAQALVQDDQPAAAARALRARLRAQADPLPDELYAALATVAFAADAASADMAQETIALAREVEKRKALRLLSSLDEPASLSEALFEVSNMYTLVGNRAGAEQLLRQVLVLQPDMAMAMNNLGYARLVAGHLDDDTVRMIETAAEMVPADPNILDTIGWLRYRQGRFSDAPEGGISGTASRSAAGMIQAALDADLAMPANPNAGPRVPSPEVLDHLGDVKWRLGDTQGANEAWTRAATVLEDRANEERILQVYMYVQTQQWGLLVASPREMYDREYGSVLKRVKAKLQALEQGVEPAVASTFAEEQSAAGH